MKKKKVLQAAVQKALDTDPLLEAEKVTGRSYKDDKTTEALGVLMFLQHNKDKDALLELSGDTTFRNKATRYLEIAKSLGFEIIHQIPFVGRAFDFIVGSEPTQEMQYFLYKRGCILEFDTLFCSIDNATMVNSSNLYYCWKPKLGQDEYYKRCEEEQVHPTESGCWHKVGDDMIWAGDHDGREGLKFHVQQLEDFGDFVYPWPVRPFFNFCTWQDWRDTEHIQKEKGFDARYNVTDKITADKLAQLPQEVRDMIPPMKA